MLGHERTTDFLGGGLVALVMKRGQCGGQSTRHRCPP